MLAYIQSAPGTGIQITTAMKAWMKPGLSTPILKITAVLKDGIDLYSYVVIPMLFYIKYYYVYV